MNMIFDAVDKNRRTIHVLQHGCHVSTELRADCRVLQPRSAELGAEDKMDHHSGEGLWHGDDFRAPRWGCNLLHRKPTARSLRLAAPWAGLHCAVGADEASLNEAIQRHQCPHTVVREVLKIQQPHLLRGGESSVQSPEQLKIHLRTRLP